MKKLKKIGICCLVFVLCFCSCYKFVNAFQNSFVFSYNGPLYQSYIGSIGFSIGNVGSSIYNDTFNLQTDFYLPDTLQNDFLISSSRDYGVDNRFTLDNITNEYFVSQDVYFSDYGVYNYQLNFDDIFVYKNADYDLPTLTIDNGYVNNEQSYDFTYKATIFDTTTLTHTVISEDNPIQLLTNDNRYFTYPLRDLFKDIVANDMVNTDNTHGGLGLIENLTITINMLDSISSNYPTTITLDNLRIVEYSREYASEEFYSALYNYESPGIFGWLLNSIDSFMSAELFPNFSIGVLLGTIVAVPLLIYILRLFMGG